MLITRKKKVPTHWVFYAQVPFAMAIAANYVTNAPFLYAMKKFIDNPAAITFLLSIEVFVTMLGGPFASWLSDRVWTRFGRRKPFIIASDIPKALTVFLMPFAPDLMTLIALRWAYGILSDLSAPNQALTMEVIPTKQRGLGSGFFQLQIQLVNLFFYLLVLGRFDDVYFSWPFHALLSVSGETLLFGAGGVLFLAISFFTWFGMHEVEPPTRKTVRDDQKPGENVVRLFLRTFLRDIFHKSLLPLYLLLMVGTLGMVNLGLLGPLLYTDQWGYSLQEMGTNIGIGAVIGIGTSLLAGWVADKTSKIRVYAGALVLSLICTVFWTIYVYTKPDKRPELHEIVIFGTVHNIFTLIAGAASYPLILEYVERNRLGTAGAGMNLFQSTIRNGFTMFIGFYVLMWSVFFLPQAGDRVRLVFKEELAAPAVRERLASAGYTEKTSHIEPLHRPGVDGSTSRHWEIRRPIESAGDAHKKLKEIDADLSKLQLTLQRPGLDAETREKTKAEISGLRDEQKKLKAELAESAKAFEAELRKLYADFLVAPGSQIVSAESSENGTRIKLTLEFVEPVTTDITPRSLPEAFGLSEPSKERKLVAQEFARLMETVDLNRVAKAEGIFTPQLTAHAKTSSTNAIEVEIVRDPDFVALENTLASTGATFESAYSLASALILPIRGLTTESSQSYTISEATASRESLAFSLSISGETPIEAAALRDAFGGAKSVRESIVDGTYPNFRVQLKFTALPEAQASGVNPVNERLRALIPNASAQEILTLQHLVQRATETAAARPVFLTVAQPVSRAEPADRKYDYFFSVQYFMIFTGILGLIIIAVIVHLERRGIIVRKGALEDANR